jgi:dTDP-4-dehydrorhamnose reductase
MGMAQSGAKRLLVTGVSGLLGLNMAWLAKDHYEVTGVLSGERAVAVPGTTPFPVLAADLSRPGQVERVLDQSRPDFIVHCAALTNVDRCETYPDEAYQMNARVPGLLAQAAASNGTRLMHISTDAIFDGLRGDYTESDEPNPINVYARTKLEGERAVAAANPKAVIARVNFYGWSWQGSRSLSEYFFNNLSRRNPVYGFTDIVFSPLLVNDMVSILLRMLEGGLGGIYHVVSRESLTKYAFGCMLARSFGFDESLISPASYRVANLKAPRSPLLNLRSEKLANDLGETLPGQEPAMQQYAELYRQGYPQLIRSLLAAALVKPTLAG